MHTASLCISQKSRRQINSTSNPPMFNVYDLFIFENKGTVSLSSTNVLHCQECLLHSQQALPYCQGLNAQYCWKGNHSPSAQHSRNWEDCAKLGLVISNLYTARAQRGANFGIQLWNARWIQTGKAPNKSSSAWESSWQCWSSSCPGHPPKSVRPTAYSIQSHIIVHLQECTRSW